MLDELSGQTRNEKLLPLEIGLVNHDISNREHNFRNKIRLIGHEDHLSLQKRAGEDLEHFFEVELLEQSGAHEFR